MLQFCIATFNVIFVLHLFWKSKFRAQKSIKCIFKRRIVIIADVKKMHVSLKNTNFNILRDLFHPNIQRFVPSDLLKFKRNTGDKKCKKPSIQSMQNMNYFGQCYCKSVKVNFSHIILLLNHRHRIIMKL